MTPDFYHKKHDARRRLAATQSKSHLISLRSQVCLKCMLIYWIRLGHSENLMQKKKNVLIFYFIFFIYSNI